MKKIDIFSEYKCRYCDREADIFIVLKGCVESIPLCSFHSIFPQTGKNEYKKNKINEDMGKIDKGEKNVKESHGT